MTMHTKVSGVWKQINGVYVKVSGTWKTVNKVSVKVGEVWKDIFVGGAPSIPEGLIVPYNGTTAPDGWSLFTSANGKYLVGAGTSYAVGATGGSNTLNHTLVAAGSHGGTFFVLGSGGSYGRGAAGSHNHTYSFSCDPLRRKLVLIQAGSEQAQFPQNTIVLSNQSAMAGLTQLFNNELSLGLASDTTGTIAADSSKTPTSSSSGAHNHTGSYCAAPGTNPQDVHCYLTNQGAHTHTVTVDTFSWAVKKRILTAFSDAAATFNLAANMIGLYENTTPPVGWSLCNGANGTPDMRDYFIYFGDKANVGAASGDNTMGWNYSTDTAGSHQHKGAQGTATGTASASHYTAITNSHSGSASGQTYLPPYYALAFIMYTG